MATKTRCKICKVETEVDKNGRCRSCHMAKWASDCGISYGKLVAEIDIPKVPTSTAQAPPPPSGWRVCPHCGKKFYAEHGKRRYCSEFCQQQANYKAHRDRIMKNQKPVPPQICIVCGNEFTPPKRDGRIKYCSDDCRSKAWEAKRHARKESRGVKDGD